jgi:hypothetical protein
VGFFVTRLLAAFFNDFFAGFRLPCLCFLTVFLARDFLATDFFAVLLTASFFAFFAFLAAVVFLAFTGISPTPQIDDVSKRGFGDQDVGGLTELSKKLAIPTVIQIDLRQALRSNLASQSFY